MFDITLITMGKLKEKFYISAADEYKKRLGGYCKFTLLELPEVRLPEDPSPAEITAGLEKEAELIFSKIPKGAWFCVFTPEGKELSSEKFATKLQEVKLTGKSSACFLIGTLPAHKCIAFTLRVCRSYRTAGSIIAYRNNYVCKFCMIIVLKNHTNAPTCGQTCRNRIIRKRQFIVRLDD